MEFKTIDQAAYLSLRAGAEVLEADVFGEKVLRLKDGFILKLFRRKRRISSASLFPYARRFLVNAIKLERMGIPVPRMVWHARIPSIERDAVLYEPLPGRTLRELSREGLDQQGKTVMRETLTRFVIELHRRGVYFRSLHIGNVVLTPERKFGLIDFSDLRIYPCRLWKSLRLRNIKRIVDVPDERDWIDIAAIAAGKLD